MVPSKEDIVRSLASNLVSCGMPSSDWREFFLHFLSEQNEESLLLLESKTTGYANLHWKSLGIAIRNFHYGTVEIYSDPAMAYPDLANGPIPMDEFFLRVAAEMIPMLVECSAPVYRSKGVIGWDGEPAEPDGDSLAQEVVASLDAMLDNLTADEASIRMCCGYYLNGTFGDGRQLSDDDFTWISEHVMELLPTLGDTFITSGFHRAHAEEILSMDTVPLRAGVL
jgi:hypothetical protein